jgi:catechol 2,3-dioxygenase-like lactoylglutathione lyase family enzyme
MFRGLQIDHVELFVPDRYEAAEWYRRTLGFDIIPEFEVWAAGAGGPLMISADGGATKLALFEGESQASRPTAGFDRVAFRVDAAGFIAFLRRLDDEPLRDDRDRLVTADSVVDHDKSYSIYFCDPYGHRLEITTYDYDATAAALGGDGAG